MTRSVSVVQPDPHNSRGISVDDVVAGIGPRLASLRAALGLSLQQMSAITDVSAASIHKIERGDMVPTITTLLKLAGAFGQPVTDLIGADDTSNDVWLIPHGTGQVLTSPHLSPAEVVVMSAPDPRFKTRAISVILPIGESFPESAGRGGEGVAYVVSGRLEAQVAGRTVRLNQGDTLHFAAEHAAVWRNDGTVPAQFVIVRSA